MDFIDEDDGLPFVLRDVAQHGLEPLLKLPAILRAGQQRGHVERKHALALERFRHFAVHDPLRKPFHDGGLAHARLADQHRIVLRPPLQDLDGTADFVVTSNHRIELPGASALGQVDGVFLQRAALAFGVLTMHLAAAAHGVDRGFERLARQAMLLGKTARVAFVIGDCEQEHLARNERIVELLRFFIRAVQQAGKVAADLDVAVRALDLRQTRHRVFQRGFQRLNLNARLREQRARRTVLLRNQRSKQMNRFDVLIVVADGETLRVGQCFLKLGRELVDSHSVHAQTLNCVAGFEFYP
ncbi:hypothetical protein PAMC26510_37600 [Caballeronia sordidicola]|uniref:Uncharacterized protein n=1 Tax=Caballeronia sordidicola TaxID=196367 RepID=A0A2C9XWQ9_CABSO|nr:hypothetical protein PAMC26510_37600 [Caballeronia sordidicola]